MPRNVAKVALLHWKEKNTEGLVLIVGGKGGRGRRGGRVGECR